MSKTSIVLQEKLSKVDLNKVKSIELLRLTKYSSEYALLCGIVDAILEEIDKLSDVNSDFYLSKIKKYLGYVLKNINHNQIYINDPIIKSLNQIKINLSKYLIDDKQVIEQITSMNNKIDKTINYVNGISSDKNIKYVNHSLKELPESDADRMKYEIIDIMFFTKKEINVIISIIKKHPNLIDVIKNNMIIIMEKLINNYIKSLYDKDIKKSQYYYELFLLLTSDKYRNDKSYPIIENLLKPELSNILNGQSTLSVECGKEINHMLKIINQKDIELKDKYQIPIIHTNYQKTNNSNSKIRLINSKELNIFTIDSKGAEVLDDAISVKNLKNGHIEITLYIINLTDIVLPNSVNDRNAFNIAQTVYAGNDCYHMLPDYINAMSLNTQKYKRAQAFTFEIPTSPFEYYKKFKIEDVIMKVDRKYTYEDVDHILYGYEHDNNSRESMEYREKVIRNRDESDRIDDIKSSKYNIHDSFFILARFALKQYLINDVRMKYLKQKDNSKLYFNWQDLPQNITGVTIVSELKLLANHYIAQMMKDNNYPFIYRANSKSSFNLPKPVKWYLENNNLKDIEEKITSNYSSSFYTGLSLKHYGIGYYPYSHSTTPLRNYAALYNQRIIQKALIDKNMDDKEGYFYEKEIPEISDYLNKRIMLDKQYLEEKNMKEKVLKK